MRYIIATAVPCLLASCVAVFPVTTTSEAPPNTACIAKGRAEGQLIRHTDGRTGKITRIHGPSARCKDPAYPDFADVDFGP
jgi:hypothetical protein